MVSVSQVCYSGVTEVSQWCHSVGTVVLQGCYDGATVAFVILGYISALFIDIACVWYRSVTVVLQCYYSGVPVVSQS
jgi:hypothetical protein